MSERGKFVAVVVASLVLGVAGMFCPDQLVRGFGEALFIAAFLAVTVDLFVKQRLAREVSQDVLVAALGFHVPAEIREEIREISSFKIIRRNVDLVYRLSRYETSPDFLWVDSELEFEVENLTDSPQPFRHLIWVEKPFRYAGMLRQILYAKAVGVEAGQEYELRDGELPQMDVKDEHAVEWCRVANIPPRGKARYWSRSRQILPAEHVDTFMLIQPSIGIKVRVYADPSLLISVNFAHRRNEEREAGGGNTWQLNAGFTPHSVVTIEWRIRTAIVPPANDPNAHERQ